MFLSLSCASPNRFPNKSDLAAETKGRTYAELDILFVGLIDTAIDHSTYQNQANKISARKFGTTEIRSLEERAGTISLT